MPFQMVLLILMSSHITLILHLKCRNSKYRLKKKKKVKINSTLCTFARDLTDLES